jgi:hypothetical protein
MEALTYRRLFDYWIRHRKITIHMLDNKGHASAFAISPPHTDEYIREVQRAIDRAEVFQIGCGEPMAREGFGEFLKRSEAVGQEQYKAVHADFCSTASASQQH